MKNLLPVEQESFREPSSFPSSEGGEPITGDELDEERDGIDANQRDTDLSPGGESIKNATAFAADVISIIDPHADPSVGWLLPNPFVVPDPNSGIERTPVILGMKVIDPF